MGYWILKHVSNYYPRFFPLQKQVQLGDIVIVQHGGIREGVVMMTTFRGIEVADIGFVKWSNVMELRQKNDIHKIIEQ